MLAPLGQRDFRLFWFGNVTKNIGHWMEVLGLGWVIVQLAVDDGVQGLAPIYLGLASVGRAVPALALGLVAGATVDRRDRRRTLIATQGAAFVSSMSLAVLVYSGQVSLLALIALIGLRSCIMTFEAPARQAFVAQIVPRSQLMRAIGWNQASFDGPGAIGPAIGGVLVALTGQLATLFVVSASTYLVMIVTLLMTTRHETPPPGDAPVGQAVTEGIRYVEQAATVRWTLILAATFALFAESAVALIPALAANALGLGLTGLSWILAGVGVGALGGAVLVAALGQTKRIGHLQIGVMAGTGLCLSALASQRDLPLVLLTAVLVGLTTALSVGVTNTILQTSTPQRLHGRVISIYSMVFVVCMPLGQLAIGMLASRLGISLAIAASGLVTVGAAGYALLRLAVIRDLELGQARSERHLDAEVTPT
jgi:MFS family permease